MKINYQKQLDALIENNCKNNIVPTLLLHSCCAPCSTYVIEYLSNYFKITVLYYNPNIGEQQEYFKRRDEQKRLISEMKTKYLVSFIDGEYNPQEFYLAVKGLENEPERGKRCSVCFSMRLGYTAKIAEENSFDYFATTLTLSPLKNAEVINNIGLNIKCRSKYLPSDFKKKEGYKRSIVLSNIYKLYRQNYCGCVFSKRGNDMVTFKRVLTDAELEQYCNLADKVWHEYFPCILSGEQIDYMVNLFFTLKALKSDMDKGYEYYFVQKNNENIGYISIHPEKDRLYLSKLYLTLDNRHKGYASQMMSFVKGIAEERGLKAVYLNVNKFNEHTIDVYKHCGFKTLYSEVNDIGNGYVMDDYVMECEI
jgi:hypothetical protein